ncbi:MAG: NAD-dependent deacylase [Dehalococcoidales bacterium]|nr:NAD-dependent deacylase [Dehalococcoidales bacterium]
MSLTREELIQKAAADLVRPHYAVALTGAGISTESGIRDFRGPDGIWTKDPAAERLAYEMYGRLRANPKDYWKETLNSPGLFGNLAEVKPNRGHFALAELEKMGILKCVITQNIDNLHERAGSQRVLDYHGNHFKLRCMRCNKRYLIEDYDLQQLNKNDELPPRCRYCNGILKLDVVYFQEPIPDDVAIQSLREMEDCDLLLICGTSAVVYPFANLPRIARNNANITIIEVNMEPTPLTEDGISDYFIPGKTGEVLPAIVAEVKKLRK